MRRRSGRSQKLQQFLDKPIREESVTANLPSGQKVVPTESNDRFRTAFERAPIGMALVALDGHVLETNGAVGTMLGYSQAEWCTKLLKDVIHPDDVTASRTQLELLITGKVHGYESERNLRHKQGHTICALVSVSSVYEEGKPSYFIVQVQDITERKRAEERLDLQSLLLSHLMEGVNLVDRAGIIRFANPAHDAIFGFAPGESVGQHIAVLSDYPPEENQRFLKAVSAEVRTQGQFSGEVRSRKKDGAPLITHRWVAPVTVAGEQFWLSMQQDISNRKQAEEALRQSEARFHNAFLHAPIGMALVTPNRRMLRVNPAFCATLGYSEQELLAWTFSDLVHPDDLAAAAADSSRLKAGEVEAYEADRRYLHKSGRIIHMQVSSSLVRDRDGEPLYFLHQSRDVTARMQAEQALRESEERFQNAFRYAPIGMALVDFDGRFLKVNRVWRDLVGFSEEELLGRSLTELVYPEDVAAAMADGTRLGAREIDAYRAERRYLHKSGRIVHFEVSVYLVTESERNPPYCVVQLQDITDRKRAEQILEARVEQRTVDLREANRRLQQEMVQRQQAEERAEGLNSRIVGLLEGMSAGFLIVHREGWRIAYVNQGGERIIQHRREEVIGKNAWEVFPDAIGTAFYDQSCRAMFDHVAGDAELYYPPYNRWLRAHIFPVPEGTCTLFEDVTERHVAEVAAVSDVLRALNAQLDVEKASLVLASGLRSITGCDRSSLTLFDDDGWATILTLEGATAYVPLPSRTKTAELPAAASVLAGQPCVIPDIQAEVDSPILRLLYAGGLRSTLSLPLRLPDGVSGMLSLSWRRRAGADRTQLPLLGQIADAVALAVERWQLFEQVRVGRERLHALSHRLLEVQEAERRHIARELHDEIGQQLTGLKFVLDAARRGPAGSALPQLAEADELIDGLVGRVRDLSLDLRPAMLDDFGLVPALLWLFDRYTAQTAVQVRFEQQGLEQRFSAEVETAAYRIVQEALTNVARHAGVDEVFVRAWAEAEVLNLQVEDSGTGFDPATGLGVSPTSGLPGMRERAFLLGGSLTVESTPGLGTQLRAELPLRE